MQEQTRRLNEVVKRVHTELAKVEERRSFLKQILGTFEYISHGTADEFVGNSTGRHLSKLSRDKISKSQKERRAREKLAASAPTESVASTPTPRKNNKTSPDWTEAEDQRVITLIKKRPIEAAEAARIMSQKLKGRTFGAVRQRIVRLAKRGLLVEKKGEGMKHLVEVTHG